MLFIKKKFKVKNMDASIKFKIMNILFKGEYIEKN